MTDAYIRDRARLLAPETLERHGTVLDVWRRWLPGRTSAMRSDSVFSREMLGQFYDFLRTTNSRLGRPRSERTCQSYVITVSELWKWAADHEEHRGVPRWRMLELRTPAAPPRPPAPTWAQMDAVIVELERSVRRQWLARLAIVMRCTGLRVDQAAAVTWGDFDLTHPGLMTVRGELGKTDPERRGRTVPVSPVLLAEMRTWSRPQLGAVVGGPPGGSQGRRERTVGNAWRATGAPSAIWSGRPEHCFRRGFQTGLIDLGADPFAVEFLVGHQLPGQMDTYTDPRAWKPRLAVDLVPPIVRPVTLGTVLRQAIAARGWRGPELAAAMGVSDPSARAWLRDATVPPAAQIEALGELLDVDVGPFRRTS